MSAPAAIEVSVETVDVRVPIARDRVAALVRRVLRAERVRAADISVTFVSAARIATLNRRHLGHRGPTDIITFELARLPDGPVHGDIYIAPDVARENARRFAVGVRDELARLVVHGVLHALGYAHPDDEEARERSEMWRRQERLLATHWPRVAAA